MTSLIQRYKYCEQVRTNHLNHFAKARNKNLALKEEAKTVISGLKKKL